MRSLILAVQFLMRLSASQPVNCTPRELARSAAWFPAVGMVIGALVMLMVWLGLFVNNWLGALLGLLMWMWVTGGLHLNGLAVLANNLSATHRYSHLGTAGVMALIAQLLSKIVLLQIVIRVEEMHVMALPLICAWARLGVLAWSSLPALPDSTENFEQTSKIALVINAALLLAVSYYFAPFLLLAPVVLLLWYLFVKYRVGGMSGDCLGAGIEISESILLCILASGPFI